MFKVNRNPGRADIRGFGRAMLIGFGVIGLVLWILSARKSGSDFWLAFVGTENQVWVGGLWLFAIVIFVLTLFSDWAINRWLYVGWMSIAAPIGLFMSTVMLSLLYFLFLPVFSLIVRRHDPLRKKIGAETYWENYPKHDHTLDRLRRSF